MYFTLSSHTRIEDSRFFGQSAKQHSVDAVVARRLRNWEGFGSPVVSVPGIGIEDLNIFEDGLVGGFAGRIESPVIDFFLEDGEETFASRIVSRSADIVEALLPTVIRYLRHHVIGDVLTSTITVKDNICRQVSAILSSLQCLQNQLLLHVLCLTRSQNCIGEYISNLTEIIEPFARSDVTDITGNDLEGTVDHKVFCKVLILVSAHLPAYIFSARYKSYWRWFPFSWQLPSPASRCWNSCELHVSWIFHHIFWDLLAFW